MLLEKAPHSIDVRHVYVPRSKNERTVLFQSNMRSALKASAPAPMTNGTRDGSSSGRDQV